MEASTDLLISQWRDAEKLKKVLQIWLTVLEEEVAGIFPQLEGVLAVAGASKGWLDALGSRLGVSRILITVNSAAQYFGFEGSGNVGFDQKPFEGVLQALNAKQMLGDIRYSEVLRARGREITANGSMEAFEEVLDAAGVEGYTITDNYDMTATITVGAEEEEKLEELQASGVLPVPAGVDVEIEVV